MSDGHAGTTEPGAPLEPDDASPAPQPVAVGSTAGDATGDTTGDTRGDTAGGTEAEHDLDDGDPTEPTDPPAKRRDVLVAVDVGDVEIAAGLVTVTGDLIDRERMEIDHRLTGDGLVDRLVDTLQPLLDRARDRHYARPLAVGVGTPGRLSPDRQLVSPDEVLAWRDFPLAARLRTALRLPVFVEHEAKALALAEGWLGAAVGKESFLAMMVSSSIGGGIVLNGQLLEGAGGNAGHIGHLIVEPNGRRCPCGSRGCLESEASGRSIESITGRPPTEPSYEIMQRTGTLVGLAVASVCNLLDLDFVVCGGPVAHGFGATFFNSAQDTLTEHARLSFSRTARIVPSRLRDKGPLVGAGAVAIRGLNRARRGHTRR